MESVRAADLRAKEDADSACGQSNQGSKHNLGGGAQVNGREAPDLSECLSLESTVHSQADTAGAYGVDGSLEELHPHCAKDFKGEEGSCAWHIPSRDDATCKYSHVGQIVLNTMPQVTRNVLTVTGKLMRGGHEIT